MDMFSNVTSNVTSWWGSGGAKKPDVNSEQTAPENTEDNKPLLTTADGSGDIGKSKDSSPATSEADSHVSNASEGEGDKEGGEEGATGSRLVSQFSTSVSAAGTKSVQSAKTFGSFLYNVANKAGKTVTETATKIKHTVGENTILGEFNKEQNAFISGKNKDLEPALPPWAGNSEEEILKQQILSLSLERRNFVRAPPSGVNFTFEYQTMYPVALATLSEDPNLEKMRFELVPKFISEEDFWKNYFYRVSLIKQSSDLSSLAQEGSDKDDSDRSRDNSFDRGISVDTDNTVPNDEFVSDSYQKVSMDKDVVKGMQQLGMQGKGRFN